MTDNQGLSPTEVEALFTETFTTHPSTTPTQVTNTIEQRFDSFVPHITEVMHRQKRSIHPKILKFTTDHVRVWKYLRENEVQEMTQPLPDSKGEVKTGIVFDLSCAARDLAMPQKTLSTLIEGLEKAGWIGCFPMGSSLGLYLITMYPPDHILAMCTITHAAPTTLTMDILTNTHLLH
ncbi:MULTISPECIES: hypothetical protein [Enterobacteriaceae]|uniref:hypothetical protein n=1 Tax=Enterobacteriaceae TaxID=543 RepID=UPI0011E3E7F6|nr:MULTISPECIES: hypothetical protein [Enterobacteriaceae]MBJ4956423.1 hypothetical protein [Salmonella enterica subsp. enterica serovar Goldcoast]HCM9425670.1 hypothetical protein [Enterobacter hormaechei subsp. xiangfangensis]EKW1516336.1 hypothetical protein [Citrobacter freundii]EKW7468328.1 hypothetical protein [Citrobacter freundii]MBA7867652.1 hypothetical protein [Enterobacter hormaechei]